MKYAVFLILFIVGWFTLIIGVILAIGIKMFGFDVVSPSKWCLFVSMLSFGLTLLIAESENERDTVCSLFSCALIILLCAF